MREAPALTVLRSAFVNAWRGVTRTWHEEASFRTQAVLGGFAVSLSAWLGEGMVVVLGFGALVLALELLNTALERLADAIHPQAHPLVGAAKDASAGAVVVAATAALVAGLVVLGPPLLDRLAGLA
jgi:diacylglycerol kinase